MRSIQPRRKFSHIGFLFGRKSSSLVCVFFAAALPSPLPLMSNLKHSTCQANVTTRYVSAAVSSSDSASHLISFLCWSSTGHAFALEHVLEGSLSPTPRSAPLQKRFRTPRRGILHGPVRPLFLSSLAALILVQHLLSRQTWNVTYHVCLP